MVKFIHVADTHLGCEIPIKFRDIRKKDFINSFKQVIDYAIKYKVDFIIHSGDFFDEYFRMTSDVMLDIIKELQRLQAHNIPIIAIKGNHDVKGHRLKSFDIFVELGLIQRLPYRDDNVCIKGLSEPESFKDTLKIFYKNALKKFTPEKDKYNIFLFHGVIDKLLISPSFLKDPRIILEQDLPNGFDYYGFGHIHIGKYIETKDRIYALPGSTEHTEISEIEERSQKKIFLVSDNKIKELPLNTRKIKIIHKEIYSESSIKELANILNTLHPEYLLKLKIRCKEELFTILINELKKFENILKLEYNISIDSLNMNISEYSLNINEKLLLSSILDKYYPQDKDKLLKLYYICKDIIEDYDLNNLSESEKDRIEEKIKLNLDKI